MGARGWGGGLGGFNIHDARDLEQCLRIQILLWNGCTQIIPERFLKGKDMNRKAKYASGGVEGGELRRGTLRQRKRKF